MVGASRTSIDNWLRRFEQEGAGGLQARQRGRPPISGRQPSALLKVRTSILSSAPKERGLWTADRVQRLLSFTLGVDISRWTVRRYLMDWGLAPPRPLAGLEARAPSLVQSWFAHEYAPLKARARRNGGVVVFFESTNVESVEERRRIYWIVGTRGEWAFLADRGQQPDAKGVLQFLNRVKQQFAGPLVLVTSRASSVTGREIKRWLDANARRLSLHPVTGPR